jgi:hypothetical protein
MNRVLDYLGALQLPDQLELLSLARVSIVVSDLSYQYCCVYKLYQMHRQSFFVVRANLKNSNKESFFQQRNREKYN